MISGLSCLRAHGRSCLWRWCSFASFAWGPVPLTGAFLTQLQKPEGEPGGGMANAIVGSLILMGLAALIGVPVGVLGGIYLSEYASNRLKWSVRFAADILNGTPSIVWGIVVYALVVCR